MDPGKNYEIQNRGRKGINIEVVKSVQDPQEARENAEAILKAA